MERKRFKAQPTGETPQLVPQRVSPTVDLRVLFGYMDTLNAIPNGTTPSPHRHRGHISLIRKAVWLIRWEERRCPKTNKRIRRTKRVYGSKKDAERALTAELKRIDAGQPARQARLTFGDWLEEHDENWCNGLSARTVHGYRAVIKTYVPKHLLRRRLQELSPSDLQELFNDMTKRGLSPTTVRGLRAVLRRALNRAMKLGLVERNVATLVDLPKPVRIEIRVLSPEEVRRFLEAAELDRFKALWYVLVTTGLRPGEALGLKWGDWDGNKLRVRRALVRVPGQGWSLEDTKTRRSRVVALPEMTIRALEEHRTRQKRERLQVGEAYVDRGLVFARNTGEPLEANNLKKRYFKPILEAAGLPDMRLYDLRHTAATLRLVNGEHPKVVQEMLGHASITLTLDTYSHVLPGMQEESAARLNALLTGTP